MKLHRTFVPWRVKNKRSKEELFERQGLKFHPAQIRKMNLACVTTWGMRSVCVCVCASERAPEDDTLSPAFVLLFLRIVSGMTTRRHVCARARLCTLPLRQEGAVLPLCRPETVRWPDAWRRWRQIARTHITREASRVGDWENHLKAPRLDTFQTCSFHIAACWCFRIRRLKDNQDLWVLVYSALCLESPAKKNKNDLSSWSSCTSHAQGKEKLLDDGMNTRLRAFYLPLVTSERASWPILKLFH